MILNPDSCFSNCDKPIIDQIKHFRKFALYLVNYEISRKLLQWLKALAAVDRQSAFRQAILPGLPPPCKGRKIETALHKDYYVARVPAGAGLALPVSAY